MKNPEAESEEEIIKGNRKKAKKNRKKTETGITKQFVTKRFFTTRRENALPVANHSDKNCLTEKEDIRLIVFPA